MFRKRAVRLIVFLLVAGGLTYWVAGDELIGRQGPNPGIKSTIKSGQVKSESTSYPTGETTKQLIENLDEEPSSKEVEKIKEIVIKQVEKIKKELLPQGKEVVEKTEAYKEVEKKIEETELEKEVIKAVCDHLLEEVDDNE